LLPPEEDLAGRRPVWDALQMFWMDTDPELFLEGAAGVCARSPYTIEEIGQIYWNEVCPAVEFNLRSVAGEWQGFDLEWLTARILERHRFGKAVPRLESHREAGSWWLRLRDRIVEIRSVVA
jgi:hypothetical protein